MSRVPRALFLAGLLFAALLGSRLLQRAATQTNPPKFGGRLVISKSAGPRSFNRLLAFDEQTITVTNCLMGALIRINRQTQQPEAELAQSWKASADGRTLTFKLRPNVKFTDGATLSADDVLFTFQLINDAKLNTAVSDQFNLAGQRVQARKDDLFTVRQLQWGK